MAVKKVLRLITWIFSFAKWKNGWDSIRYIQPLLLQSLVSVLFIKLQIQPQKSQTGHFPLSLISFLPRGPCWSGLEIFWPKAAPPLVGCGTVLYGVDFHTIPSVPFQTGVKFEYFVYPLRVEGNINKKRRLRRGTFCPLNAHTDDDFAFMFLANQWTTVVFLHGQGG